MCYVELQCHSTFSLQEGASFNHELLSRAVELGYPALAITDHDNLCGAMEFAREARSLGVQPIIGAEVTMQGGYHITLLAETRQGYGNLCQLLSEAHLTTDRREPELDSRFLAEHAPGLILPPGSRVPECPPAFVRTWVLQCSRTGCRPRRSSPASRAAIPGATS